MPYEGKPIKTFNHKKQAFLIPMGNVLKDNNKVIDFLFCFLLSGRVLWHNANFKTDNSVKMGTENQLIKMSYMVGFPLSEFNLSRKIIVLPELTTLFGYSFFLT